MDQSGLKWTDKAYLSMENILESGQIALEMALRSGDALQLGADIAWDVFIFLSVLFPAVSIRIIFSLKWIENKK